MFSFCSFALKKQYTVARFIIWYTRRKTILIEKNQSLHKNTDSQVS